MDNQRQIVGYGDNYLPFYGGQNREMFAIERQCMDRQGKVIDYLRQVLPRGLIIDIGAGDGFTAQSLNGDGRCIIPIEPDPRMIDHDKRLAWVRGVAQDIPFHNNVFQAGYATWAFFLAGVAKRDCGLAELCRVVEPDGLIVIIDNAGNDEFCSLSPRPIASENDHRWWQVRGFEYIIIDTAFEFDSIEQARSLLSFYFGDGIKNDITKTTIEYKVIAYQARCCQVKYARFAASN